MALEDNFLRLDPNYYLTEQEYWGTQEEEEEDDCLANSGLVNCE